MSNQFELVLLNQPSEISRLQDQLESFARQHGLVARALHDAQLALEEHLANILAHAFVDGREHQIHVRVQFNAPELCITVEDDGRPFDPLGELSPDVSRPIEERPVGGLGIHMMRRVLDKLEYRRANGRNIVVMRKRATVPVP